MIRFHMLIPAEDPARTGQSLNVLLVTENAADQDLSVVIRIYGSLGKEWRELLAEERELPASFGGFLGGRCGGAVACGRTSASGSLRTGDTGVF